MKQGRLLGLAVVVVASLCSAGRVARAQPAASSPVVSPDVGADHKVTFRLLAPNTKDVKIMGDFTASDIALSKDDKGLWSYTTGPLTPGVYGYYFKLEGVRVADPGNLLISSGAQYLKSYVEVPGDKPEYWAVRDVPHGALHEHLYKSPTLGTTRRVIVYTPPGYSSSNEKAYPTIYLYHGSGDNETFWSRVGRANQIMDNLLADGKAKPALVVMAYGHSSVPPGPEGGTGGVELYEISIIQKDLLDNIIPLIDREYRVGKEGKDRAITGISMGGYQSLTIGLNNPSHFGYVAGFSGGFRPNQNLDANFAGLLADTDAANKQLKLVQVRIGAGEGGLAANRRVDQFLTAKGIRHEYLATENGLHSWLSWRAYFRDLVPRLFTETVADASPAAANAPIFNGKDLTGWKVPSPNRWWKVVDGVIIGENDASLRGNDLYTEKSYKDVDFQTEFRFKGEIDSGIFLRKPLIQVQIGISRSLKVDKTCSLYQEGPGGRYVADAVGVDKLLKDGEWNKLRFVAKGDNLKVWLNGEQVLDCSIAKYPEAAPLGLQIHRGVKMKVEYRNMVAVE